MNPDTPLFNAFLEDMKDIVRSKLADLYASESLAAVTVYDAYKFDFIHYWNTFVTEGFEGMRTADARFFVDDVRRIFIREMFGVREHFTQQHKDMDRDDPEVIAHLRSELEVMLQAGDMTKPYMTIEAHSPVVDQRFNVTLHNWQPKLWKFDDTLGDYVEPPMIDIKPVTHLQVEFSSGELLIADWLRVDEITYIIADAHKDYNICHASDRIERSIHGAKSFNIVEVKSGGFSPSIVKDPAGRIRIGTRMVDEFSDEPTDPDLHHMGSITTDVNAITIADRADFQEFVATHLGAEIAAERVDYLVNNHPYQKPAKIQVEPGLWHVYFIDDAVAKEDCIEQIALIGGGMETTLILSREVIPFPPDVLREA